VNPNPNIDGWASNIHPWQEEVAVRYLPKGGTYLEIGTFLGASLAHIGTLRPDISLIAVDPWLDEPSGELDVGYPTPTHRGWAGLGIYEELVRAHGGLWFAFLATMRKHAPDVLRRTRVIRGTADTVRLLDPVDVLFIDGAHDRPNVEKDHAAFAPLVKPGGLVSGHDYDDFWPGVVGTVNAHYPKERIHTRETCWWVVK
jgi:Methyltransferase domain